MFMQRSYSQPLLLIALFLSVPAMAAVGHHAFDCRSQQAQALPQSAADWLKLGIELSRTSTNSQEAIAAFREAVRRKPDFEAAYLQLSSALRAAGKPDEQIAVLNSAREFIPSSIEVMKALRAALLGEKNYSELVKISPEYLSLQPRDALARNDFGWALMQLKRYDEAAIELEEAVAVDEKLGIALHNLAATYSNLGRTEEALRTYERILEVDPNYAKRDAVWGYRISLLLKLNRSSDALTVVAKELEQDPESGLAYALRGRIRLAQMDIENAISDLKTAEELGCPYSIKPDLYLDLGWAYLQMSRYPDAIEELKKAVDLKSDSFQAQSLLASAYARASLCDKAMEPFEKAIRLNPEAGGIYNNLSVCFMKLGRLDDAEKGLRYAIQLEPENVLPRLNLSRLLVRLKRIKEAESELRTTVRMNIADWRVYSFLADLLMMQKNLAEAVPFLRQALRLRPEEPMILNNLGYALLELNEKLDEAFDLIQRAVKRSPYNAALRDSLGWAYFKLGKLPDAERELTEATRRDPKSPAGFEHLGDVYQKLGKAGDARTCWQKALSLIADDDVMKSRLLAKLDAK
jgi:tetratricopeptide (TPR) repeat protein